MYRRGDLRVTNDRDVLYDTQEEYDEVKANSAYLPHCCDEWIIGGRPQVEDLIADCQHYLEQSDPANQRNG